MGYKWNHKYKPSREEAKRFAEQMKEIEVFCAENGISKSLKGDSYYFTLNGVKYRVSNHTIEASNRKAYDEDGVKVREEYHPIREDNMVYITASKTRIIQIYSDLKAGKTLNKRGYCIG